MHQFRWSLAEPVAYAVRLNEAPNACVRISCRRSYEVSQALYKFSHQLGGINAGVENGQAAVALLNFVKSNHDPRAHGVPVLVGPGQLEIADARGACRRFFVDQ